MKIALLLIMVGVKVQRDFILAHTFQRTNLFGGKINMIWQPESWDFYLILLVSGLLPPMVLSEARTFVTVLSALVPASLPRPGAQGCLSAPCATCLNAHISPRSLPFTSWKVIFTFPTKKETWANDLSEQSNFLCLFPKAACSGYIYSSWAKSASDQETLRDCGSQK